jgi:hypothetical protein
MANHSYPRIIGLNGVARAGKDTVAEILHSLYGYQTASYSDMLNKALIALDPVVLIPWNLDVSLPLIVSGVRPGDPLLLRYSDLVDQTGYEKAKEVPEVRRLLQRMGTEVGRNMLGEDIWVDALFTNLEGGPVAITNVRFPNEYDAVKQRGGVVWRVDRPGFEPANNHISDRALDAHSFDARIYNDGSVRDLADKVMRLMDPVQAVYA